MTDLVFTRQSRGLYTAGNWRFVLEFQQSTHTWKLRDSGDLVGFKPGVSRTARVDSPIWHRSHSARAAVAWAKHTIRERAALARLANESGQHNPPARR